MEAALRSHPDIGVVYTTHHETGTGVLNPVRELGALVHRYGGVFIVDTTSSCHDPDRHRKDNIDFCMASAQKGIMGMTGLSYVIGDMALIERSAAYPKRSYYCNLYLQYSFFETTGEMHFTPPVQVVYAAAQALREYFEEGNPASGSGIGGFAPPSKGWRRSASGSDPAGISVVAGCQRPVSRRSPLEF